MSLQLEPPEPKKVDTEDGRFYDVPGVGMLPSVTTVLQIIAKAGLIPWSRNKALEVVEHRLLSESEALPPAQVSALMKEAKGYPDRVKREAGAIGSQVHAAIEAYLQASPGGTPNTLIAPPQVQTATQNFIAWYEGSGLEIIAQEQGVHSKKHGYAGTLDAIARVRGDQGLLVCDWKSGNGIHDEAALQLAAYVFAYEEMHNVPIRGAFVVRLSKFANARSPYEVRQVSNLEACFETFLAALALWRGMKQAKWG